MSAVTADATLWALAAMLAALAVWLTGREGERWDPAVLFAAAMGARWGGVPPLTGGPIEPKGWDGKLDELPDAYLPERRLAPGLGWADIQEFTPAARDAVARRLSDVRLVWIGQPIVVVPGVETSQAPWPATPEAIAEVLEPLLERPEVRLVAAAGGEAAQGLLALLREAPRLRDRLRAALLLAPELDAAWVAEKFTHEGFDTELAREVPYLALRLPDGAPLPDPPEPPSARRAVLPVDLGVVEPDTVLDARLGQALAVVLAAVG